MRRPSSGSNRGLTQQGEPTGLLRSGRRAERTERRAKLLGEDLRLLPGGEVPTPSGLVVVGEVAVALLHPASRRDVDLAREGGEPGRDGDWRGRLARAA